MNISTLFYTKHNIQPSLKLPASFYTSGPHKDKDKCWTDRDNFTMCTEGFLARSRLQAFHWQPACRALREETSMISPLSCKSEQGLPAGCEIKSILPVLCSLFLNTSAWTVLLTFCSCFNLVAVVNFQPSQSHLLHSLHTFSLEKAQRKGNWSISQTKRVMNILMFCSLSVLLNYQIFRNKSSIASFTPAVTPSSSCVHGVSSICGTSQTNKTGWLPNPKTSQFKATALHIFMHTGNYIRASNFLTDNRIREKSDVTHRQKHMHWLDHKFNRKVGKAENRSLHLGRQKEEETKWKEKHIPGKKFLAFSISIQ